MSSFKKSYIHKNSYTRPGVKLRAVRKLVIHYTATSGATAANEHDYFDGTCVKAKRYASAHIFVDKKEALNIIPLNEVAYHANDVQKKNADGSPWRGVPAIAPDANFESIGVELCIEKDWKFDKKTVTRAQQVFAELCKTYKLNAGDIVRHYDVTRKNCPAPYVSDEGAFEDFKAGVAKLLNKKSVVKKVINKVTAKYPGHLIQIGSRGSDVKKIQKLLKITADGIFGAKTASAVKAFQKKHGLAVDGVVGARTWSVMF